MGCPSLRISVTMISEWSCGADKGRGSVTPNAGLCPSSRRTFALPSPIEPGGESEPLYKFATKSRQKAVLAGGAFGPNPPGAAGKACLCLAAGKIIRFHEE